MILRLARDVFTERSTFAVLSCPGLKAIFAVEQKSHHLGQRNTPGLTCILPGTYALSYEISPRLSRIAGRDFFTLRLDGVIGRSGILIHAANRADQLEGCIAPGLRREISNTSEVVIDSRRAVDMLELAVRAELGRGTKCYIAVTELVSLAV